MSNSIMKHYLIYVALVALLVLAATAVLAQMQAPAKPISVVVDGRAQRYDTPPMMLQDRVMVPMRGIFETLGAQVNWNAQQQTVVASHQGKRVSLQAGRPTATVNNERVNLDAAPQMHQNRMYVPLRFVSETLGANVSWEASANRVVVRSTGVAQETATRPPAQPQTSSIERGKEVYKAENCGACHVIAGQGGKSGPDLTKVGSRLSRAEIRRVIDNGAPGMPAYDLPAARMDPLVDYMVSLK